MKTKTCQQNKNQASALVITMCVIAIAVLVLASYLMTVQNQISSVSRSQTWNSAISLAEAGMEEGMAMVNLGSPSIIVDPWAWTNSLSGAGWTISGTNATRTRIVSGSNYYVTSIGFNGTNAPTISSAGVVSYTTIPWVFSDSGMSPFLAVVGLTNTQQQSTTTSTLMGRKIQVSTTLSPLFTAALVCKSNFDMSGKNATVDSFDSSDPTKSTAGQWTALQRQAHGDVGSDSGVVGDINVGNGSIYGSVFTGPGSAQNNVQIGPNGAVGDLGWVTSSTGIEAGHWSGNFNVNMPDVGAPNTSGWSTSLPAAVSGTITLSGANNYVVTSDPGSPLNITGPTVLWIQGSLSLSTITIAATNNAKLILYVGNTSGSATSISWAGNNSINQPGYSANLEIYGLPNLTSIDLHGNAGWNGTIYAPEADFVGGGGGNNNQDCSGAVIVHSIKLNGHWNFHYDEHLRAAGASRGWIATGWKEVPLQ